MSAICGIYSLDASFISVETRTNMMNYLAKYPADRSEVWHENQVFFGCHLQYVTPESINEILPFHDEKTFLAITADAIIDNRKELLACFDIPKSEWDKVPDSRLILSSYIKWGADCPKHLVGDFAFAIWNERSKELFCARDHTGKRTLYYYRGEKIFAFSTLMKPLSTIAKNGKKLNELWVADFLTIPMVGHEFDCRQTVYKDIYQLPPAHFMVINHTGVSIEKYWKPLDVPQLKYRTDMEYEEAFREIFYEAVNCRTRSLGSVGMMLSGGMDSGSVACVAAGQLKEKGKRLKAFSAVPMEGYRNWLPRRLLADESSYIEAISEAAGNIDVTYCRFEGKHSLTGAYKFLEIMEQPYKTIENLFWMDGIAEAAAQNGCSVLLDGQFGNASISYGSFLTHIYSLYKKLKFKSIYDEITAYSRLHNISRKKVGKHIAVRLLPYPLQMLRSAVAEGKSKGTPLSPVSPDFARRCRVNERLKKEGFDPSPYRKYDALKMRELKIHPAAFSHIGAMETKLSLAHSIAKRDPTRDKRIIEFCVSLPENQYVRNGQDRYLIRRSMSGILPDKIRLNSTVKGRQSADWVQRLLPIWDDIQQEINEMLAGERFDPYIDTSMLKAILQDFKGLLPDSKQEYTVRMLLICMIFGYFLEDMEKDQ